MNLPAQWLTPTVSAPEPTPNRLRNGAVAALMLLAAWPTWQILPSALTADKPEITILVLLFTAPVTALSVLAMLVSLAFPKRVLWRILAGYVLLMLAAWAVLPQVFLAAGLDPGRLLRPGADVAVNEPRHSRQPAAVVSVATASTPRPMPAAPTASATSVSAPAVAPTPAAPTLVAAAQLVPFEGQRDPGACSALAAALPADTLVYAAGAYGGRPLNYQIDKNSNHEATRIDVSVDEPAAPVALMLGAYEPTVWNIGWSPRTRIVAVMVSGYHHQALAGLPAAVPRIVGSHDQGGPCPSFYVSQDTLATLNPIAQRAFQRKLTRAYQARNGAVSVGSGAGAALVTDASRPPDQFKLANQPLAGEAGLRDAIAKGWLREATRADLSGWESAVRASAGDELPPLSGSEPSIASAPGAPWHTYVVIRPMQIPAGLYGAHAATFIVPRGVQRPSGELGHSRILDFNTLSCAGATCGMSMN
ncbi:MAG TPA: hypothetical protein VM687_11230 [Stenotrophomonas sp.]|nr:hypothetical protein [Stenotrophomonas sp.]